MLKKRVQGKGQPKKSKKENKKMKTIYNNKRYDSDKCEVLATRSHYNNGNYAGTTSIVRASDGQLLILCESNGQDLYYNNDFYVPCGDINFDGYNMSEDQAKRCAELGLIEDIK